MGARSAVSHYCTSADDKTDSFGQPWQLIAKSRERSVMIVRGEAVFDEVQRAWTH
jgi:hypothetical protein